jgi:predicted ArsR family transcriptional regulator
LTYYEYRLNLLKCSVDKVNMSKTAFDERFFESTRGRIVLLLRQSHKTVNDLSRDLDLTDNAVRAHLLSLERDRLVESAGTIKGIRKPHVIYRLTDEARHIFPKSYDSLLNRLLDVLKNRLPTRSLSSILYDVGTMIGRSKEIHSVSPLNKRVDAALDSLKELGGAATATEEGGLVLIKSESCPFADAVAEHPEVCKVAESMVAEIVGLRTTETCDRSSTPKCRFKIEADVI